MADRGRGRSKQTTRSKGPKPKGPVNNGPKKSLVFDNVNVQNQNAKSEKSLATGNENNGDQNDHNLTLTQSQSYTNTIKGSKVAVTGGEIELDIQNSQNSFVNSAKGSVTGEEREMNFHRSQNGTENRPTTVTENMGLEGHSSFNSTDSGSRYQTLDKMCNTCDNLCAEAPGIKSDNIQCNSCKAWYHINCVQGKKDDLLDQKAQNSHVCNSCAMSEADDIPSEMESSMNSEDRYRAQYDADLDIETEFEDELLRIDEPENNDVLKSTPIAHDTNHAVPESTNNYTGNDNYQGKALKSASLENKINQEQAMKSAAFGTDSHQGQVLKSANFGIDSHQGKALENANFGFDSHQGQALKSANSGVDSHQGQALKSATTSDTRYSNTAESKPNSLNNTDQTRFKIDSKKSKVAPNKNVRQSKNAKAYRRDPTDDEFEYPPSYREDRIRNQNDDIMANPLEDKMNQILSVVQDLDSKVNQQKTNNERLIKDSTDKMNQNVQKLLTDTLGRIERENNEKFKTEIDRRVKESFDRQLSRDFSSRVENAINKRIGPEVDMFVNDRVYHLEQRLEQSYNERVEPMITQRIESELDEFRDKMWRNKNVLIVNLQESRNPDIDSRIADDLDEVYRIFNLFINFEESDADGKPVRLGRISDRPRTLRITLKSERMVGELVKKAREQNHILNPDQNDNRKKIYINRDYTERERYSRKRAMDELKDRQSKGETNLIIKKGRVVHREGNSMESDQQPGQRNNFDNYQPNQAQQDRRPNQSQATRDNWQRNTNQSNSSHGRPAQGYHPNINNQQARHRQQMEIRQPTQQRKGGNRGQENPQPNLYQRDGNHGQARRNSFEINQETEDKNKFRSPMFRDDLGRRNSFEINQETEDKNKHRSPMLRDDIGTYIRGEDGRAIRGAEGGYSQSRDRRENRRDDHDERRPYKENHAEDRHIRNERSDGYRRDYSQDRYRGNEERHENYRRGRAVREASRQPNRNKPGSVPYGRQSHHR